MVVPNSLIASQTAINLSANDPRVICPVLMAISHVADLDQARAILLELAGKHPLATQVCECPLTQLGSSGAILSLNSSPTRGRVIPHGGVIATAIKSS